MQLPNEPPKHLFALTESVCLWVEGRPHVDKDEAKLNPQDRE